MNKFFLFLVIIVSITLADNKLFIEEFGTKSPGKNRQLIYKANKDLPVDIYRSNGDDNTLEAKYFFFHLSNSRQNMWVNTPENLFLDIKPLKLIQNNLLLFQGSTPTWTASYLLNIRNGKVTPLGGGTAEYIDNDHFVLHGYKGYVMRNRTDPLGAYWTDILVDKEGHIIKFLSSGDICYPLRYLIDTDGKYPKLIQDINQKICVEQ